MTDQPVAAAMGGPGADGTGVAPVSAHAGATVNDRPELAVGAAFGGGLLLALLLKRLAR